MVEPGFKSSDDGSIEPDATLSIGAVAELVGVATSTLRYYERRGLVDADARVAGQRRYGLSTIRRLVFVQMLQDAGLSLDDIRGVLDAEDNQTWKEIARRRLARLDEDIARLHLSRELLSAALFCRFDHPLDECQIMNEEIDRRLAGADGATRNPKGAAHTNKSAEVISKVAVDDAAIAGCNSLTRRWLDHVDSEESFVLSGAGAWLVLAALAHGATGEACTELEDAVGIPATDASQRMSAVTSLLGAMPGVASALGVWVNPSVPIRDEFIEALPDVTVEALPRDVALLDRWVRSQTSEMISSFPAPVTPETLLVAASALASEADWVHPFDEGKGQWRGAGDWVPWLYRRTSDRSQAAIIESSHSRVGRVVCATASDFDVHLLTGADDMDAASVLEAGLDAVEGSAPIVDGASLRRGDDAGCLTTRKTRSQASELVIGLPGFEVDSSWDLTAQSACFGLTTAMDSTRGHFGEISPEPLAIENAGQSCVAGFSATGFRAAAATFAAIRAGAGQPTKKHTVVSVDLDRPFGFLVVHREAALVMFAGWVHDLGEQPALPGAVVV